MIDQENPEINFTAEKARLLSNQHMPNFFSYDADLFDNPLLSEQFLPFGGVQGNEDDDDFFEEAGKPFKMPFFDNLADD